MSSNQYTNAAHGLVAKFNTIRGTLGDDQTLATLAVANATLAVAEELRMIREALTAPPPRHTAGPVPPPPPAPRI
jgi:hypothetical protein